MSALSVDDVLLQVMGCVPPLDVMRSFSVVCSKWRHVVLERDYWLALHTRTWRHPLQYVGDVPLHVYCCARLHVETVALPRAFADAEFRECLQLGKYSRWALSAPSCKFVKTLAWAVRVVGTFPTAEYCFEGHGVYQPDSRAGDGWDIGNYDTYTLPPRAMVGILMLHLACETDPREYADVTPYDVVNDVHVAFPEDASRARALDAMEYVRLLRFIVSDREVFAGVMWDCCNITSRGVNDMMRSPELTLPLVQEKYRSFLGNGTGNGLPQPRQVPPTFNIIRLCEYAASKKDLEKNKEFVPSLYCLSCSIT